MGKVTEKLLKTEKHFINAFIVLLEITRLEFSVIFYKNVPLFVDTFFKQYIKIFNHESLYV